MFNVIEKDMQWRRSQGLPEGFEMLKKRKPTVAVGAEGPLGGSVLMADYYRIWFPSTADLTGLSAEYHRWR